MQPRVEAKFDWPSDFDFPKPRMVRVEEKVELTGGKNTGNRQYGGTLFTNPVISDLLRREDWYVRVPVGR